MRWIHIDFWFDITIPFRRYKYLNKEKQEEFENLLKTIIESSKKFVVRKFYLYEDLPHCFLALELKSVFFLPQIEKILKQIKKPEFIYRMQINQHAGNDQGNGDGFLDVINAFTEFYLFKRDNRITHLIHCCMDFMLQSRQNECSFYRNMAVLYQVKKIKNKKVVYGYKKITPKLRKKLMRYVSSLDLRRIR